MTYDELVDMAKAMPDVCEGTSYGDLSVKRGARWMFSLKKNGETIALKLNWKSHDILLPANPDVIFKTPHYEGYPAFLVRLEQLTPTLAESLVKASWEDAPNPAKKIK